MITYKLFNKLDFRKKTYNNLTIQGHCLWHDAELDCCKHLIKDLKNEELEYLNGFYSIYYLSETEAICLTDRIRSYPIFYAVVNSKIWISDNPYWIATEINDRLSLKNESDFMYTFFTLRDTTLFENVKQLEAGEILTYNEHGLSIKKYGQMKYHYDYKRTNESYFNAHCDALNNIFKHLIDHAKGRTLAVPLSGGYDSRLIVLMLKKLGYKNVIAFTYGNETSEDVRLSKAVADRLEIKWLYIDIDKDEYSSASTNKEYLEYLSYAGKATSVPHLQDWLVIKKMKDQDLIPSDCIFVPGHVGDILSGECSDRKAGLYRCTTANNRRAASAIVDYLFTEKLLSHKEIKYYEQYICDEMSNYEGIVDSASAYELWWMNERTSKFIVNSVRTYEFFGYDWWLPLADRDYFKFWESVPLKYRVEQKLYSDAILLLMNEVMGISIQREGEQTAVKKKIKGICTQFVSINRRNKIKSIFKNEKKKVNKQYDDLNPVWFFCINSIEDYKYYKNKSFSVNYAIGMQYLNYLKMGIFRR